MRQLRRLLTAIRGLVRRTPLVVLVAEHMNTIDMMAVNHGFYLEVLNLTHSARMIVSYCSFIKGHSSCRRDSLNITVMKSLIWIVLSKFCYFEWDVACL